MAYGLRYYKELTHPDGKVVRLEILEKGGTIAAKEIGPVCQALRLDIQGDTEIDAPIVKTSLTMTFVDAPDHPEAKAKKCGNWAEFYTSDSTLWQVKVKVKNAKETAFNTIWTGYVTPDSFTEVLQYRGSVTIVARDNIGHLNDFSFDAEGNADGMISLRELVQAAWAKIENPMEVIYYSDDWMLSEGVNALNTMMNVSAFEDMNWYDALESALFGYGATLRWIGGNEVIVRPLRMLPYMGRSAQQTIITQDPIFMSGAERELTPAVRRIEESVSYELDERFAVPLAKSVSFTGATATIPYNSRTLLDGTKVVNIPTWPIANKTNEGWGNGDKTLFLNPKAYSTTALASELGDSLVLATNTDGSGRVWYGRYMQGKNFTLSVSFGQMIERSNSSLVTIMFNPVTVKKVVASISATANGITKYLNAGGVWQTSEEFMDFEVDAETRSISKNIPIGTFSTSESLVKFTIKDITLGGLDGNDWWDVSDGGGIYVELNSLTYADNSGIALCETNRVNTNYNTENNIILSRDPKIAPALNDVLFPSFIKNGIFVQDGKTYNPAKTWNWEGQTPQQMAVYNHLQLLCYHAKPNNILRGTIVNADNTNLQTLWMWQGAEHMLVSGSLNFLNGYIENAVLREFARYEDMWGMLAPADFPEVEGKSRTTAEGGASAASEGARTTSTTTVNIGGGGGSMTIDTFMSDTSTNAVGNRYIKAYVDDLGNDITEAYEAAIRALNTQIQGFLDDKVDDAVFDSLAAQVEVNKTSIDTLKTKVSTAESEIDTLQTYTSWLDSVKALLKVENGNIKIDTNLIVTKDTSSGGSGQDTPASGTVTGIKVSATQTLTPNNAGVIDMVSTLASIDVSSQLANYALKDTVNTQFALVNSALSGKQDAITSSNKLAYSLISGTPTIPTKTSQIAEDTNLYFTNARAVSAVMGSSAVGSTSAYPYWTGSKWATKTLGARAFDDTAYLPLSGGRMTGTILVGDYTAFGQTGGNFYLGTPDYPLLLRSNGTTTINGNTLLHEGNIGSYALKIAGTNARPILLTPYENLNDYGYGYYSYVNGNDPENQYGTNAVLFAFRSYRGNDTWQIAFDGNGINNTAGPNFAIRGNFADIGWTAWYRIATTSGNVASATKLQTARTIWGQSFDGSGNVDGILYMTNDEPINSSYSSAGVLGIANNTLYLGYSNVGYNTTVNGRNISIQTSADGVTRFLVNSSGNVTIGASDLAGTSAKLYVDGAVKVNGLRASVISIECDASGNTSGYGGEINRFGGGQLWIQAREGGLQLGNSASTTNFNGAVTMSSTLAVTGNITCSSNLIVSGDTSSGSDIRFKDIISHKTLKIEDIANAPLFTFTWNDREDDTIHLGSSAQYWEKVTPWLVKGEDFKTLDYSTLGVAMGISLAKKAVNHEERIKILEKENKALKAELNRISYGG